MNLRRGACPSLTEPMQTGDGLLARLNPVDGRLSGKQLSGLARAAAECGNGILEITGRGSLQVRGLTQASTARFADKVDGLSIANETGLPVQTGPLAGLDADEIADPRPLARAIRRRSAEKGLPRRLGPKVSVTVDGGGAMSLEGLIADVKLKAVRSRYDETVPTWLVGTGGNAADMRLLGRFDAEQAVDLAICVLEAVAERGVTARARDLLDAELAAIAATSPAPASSADVQAPRKPVGLFALAKGRRARGFCLPYGQLESGDLSAFAEIIGSGREIRLAPGRGLIVLDADEREDSVLLAAANELGLVTRPDDPRLALAVCAGRPACASAHLATRKLADRIAARRPDLLDGSFFLHLSGCEKQCARPPGPSVTVQARRDGYDLISSGMPVPADLAPLLEEIAGDCLHPSGGPRR